MVGIAQNVWKNVKISAKIMRKDRIPKKSGDEQDALSKNHTIHGYNSKTRKKIKKNYNKRARKMAKNDEIPSAASDCEPAEVVEINSDRLATFWQMLDFAEAWYENIASEQDGADEVIKMIEEFKKTSQYPTGPEAFKDEIEEMKRILRG